MGDRFRIGRRGPMEPSEDLDFTTSLHDGWVVAFLLTCAPLGRAVVNFGDDESSDLTSNRVPASGSAKFDEIECFFWPLCEIGPLFGY